MRSIQKISAKAKQAGFMLIELLIAVVVLTVGLAGLLVLLITAMNTDKVASGDTASTMVAEHVLEQITAQGLGADGVLQITDCANNVSNINTARPAAVGVNTGTGGPFGGNGANLTANGKIDWTQAVAAVPAGYGIQYAACGAGGRQTTYDVRWDVIRMSANNRLTVISARPLGSTQVGGLKFVVPVNLRTID